MPGAFLDYLSASLNPIFVKEGKFYDEKNLVNLLFRKVTKSFKEYGNRV